MIICGYQGIGKSTLARDRLICDKFPVIDLESGNFWVDGKRSNDWYKIYANIAVHLSQQKNIVILSSHKVVRDYLYDLHSGERLATIYPAIDLKDEWIEKLQQRYDLSKKEKDYKALMNAKEMYEENIRDLANQSGFDHIQLNADYYSLEFVITKYYLLATMLLDEKPILQKDDEDATIILKEYNENE